MKTNMIGYVTLGTNDLEKSLKFYDAVLGELGGKRLFNSERLQLYGTGASPMVGVCKPYDGQPSTFGNGTMVAFAAPDRATVDKVHATALAAGAADEGTPGERMPTFYAAYFRDLDGNKLCVFKMG